MAPPIASPALATLLSRSHPTLLPSADAIDLTTLSPALFPSTTYTPAETAEIASWLPKFVTEPTAEDVVALNEHLATRTTILGAKPSVVDVAAYVALAPVVKGWDAQKRTGEEGLHHVVRFVDFVQGAKEVYGLEIAEGEKVGINVDEVVSVPKVKVVKKEGGEKEGKKEKKGKKGKDGDAKDAPVAQEGQTKELPIRSKPEEQAGQQAQAQSAGQPAQKKEKKQKQPKQKQPPAAPALPPSPSVIDLRVGHILRAIRHPNADSLFVSTINCGDAPGAENTSVDDATGLTVRTVCSGLNGLVPLEEMQGRKIVAVCNLKPVTMRGIKSCAMVLAASPRPKEGEEDSHAGPVELVSPPEGLEAGARLSFEGWSEGLPEKQLNPKKKVWETYAPGFCTNEGCEVGFDAGRVEVCKVQVKEEEKMVGRLVSEDGRVCTVKTLKGGVVR